jgi:trans-2,3-dihydro-3-hydroxyanthranilate isomerase
VSYVTVDVFTHARFAGNPLAVIPDACSLTEAQMQKIAAEFNYSESAFVLPPASLANTARVRIFTPTDEIPFAGHPNVGTAFVLGRQGELFGRAVPDVMQFEEKAGLVTVALTREAGAILGARIEVPRPLEIAHSLDAETVAACASLAVGDLRQGGIAPVMASVGLPFALVELESLQALARARPDNAAFARADRRYPHPDDHFALFLFHREQRMAAGSGACRSWSNTPEDPATARLPYSPRVSFAPPGRTSTSVPREAGVRWAAPSTITSRSRRRRAQ